MTLIIAYICLAGFGMPWFWYIVVLILWVMRHTFVTMVRSTLAKQSQLTTLEVNTMNRLMLIEQTAKDIYARVKRLPL